VPFGDSLSEARFIAVDVGENALRYTPVSSYTLGSLVPGQFYTGLTRDDVGGLRYLLRAGHVHWRTCRSIASSFFTNNSPSALTLLSTSNLTLFAAQSLTNDDAGLTAIYPGLAIVPGSTTTSFSNVVTANPVGYYANNPFDPVGTPPHLVFAPTTRPT